MISDNNTESIKPIFRYQTEQVEKENERLNDLDILDGLLQRYSHSELKQPSKTGYTDYVATFPINSATKKQMVDSEDSIDLLFTKLDGLSIVSTTEVVEVNGTMVINACLIYEPQKVITDEYHRVMNDEE